MQRLKIVAALLLFVTTLTSAQQKDITLEDIWGGTFRTQGLTSLHSLKNGKQYSVLNFDRQSRTMFMIMRL